MTDANLFADDHNSDNVDYLNELVGEGKKFSTVEALARGKAESDAFIEKLKTELAEARTEVQKRIALEELKTAILDRQNGNSNNDSGQPPVGNENTTDSIEEIVNKALDTKEKLTKAAANEAVVTEKIKEVWGDNAKEELRKAAGTLGMSVSELGELGRKNPQALFKLIGVNHPKSPSGAQVPTGTVRFEDNNEAVRNNAYYSKLRRENPKLYYDKRTQVQMHKDAMTLRESFF